MKLQRIVIMAAAAITSLSFTHAQAETIEKLTGRVIGTTQSFDYDLNTPSTTVNTREMAFDGDVNTFFASDARDHTWVGLDLGTPCVIKKVGWSPRNDYNVGAGRVVLGLFEGANLEDFSDAVPLYIIKEEGTYGAISSAEVNCGKGFRYVRYCGPWNVRCNIAEVEFYGYPSEGEEQYATLTGIPIVVINTVNGEEPQGKEKEDEKESTIKIISPEGELLSAPGTLRLRGNASMQFDKKPYRIKFDKKQQPLDAPAKAKKWTLLNNYGDKSLMRNLLAWEIARTFPQVWTPYGRAVDVVVNGEYKGCYQLCDQVEVGKNRMPLEEVEVENIASTPAESFDYFIEIDGYAGNTEPWAVPENWETDYLVPVTLQSPDPDDLMEAGSNEPYYYVKEHYQQMENAVMDAQFPDNGYDELLDTDSFLIHFLIGEITANPDVYWSTYMYKRAGDEKFYTGPEWDFDIAFGNDYRTYSQIFTNRWTYPLGMPAGAKESNGWYNPAMHNFANQIIRKDSRSLPRAKRLYEKAENNGLTAELLCDFIDRTAAEIDESQRLNFMRWKILDQAVHMNPGETLRSTYGEYVDLLKDFVTRRLDYIKNKSFSGVESSDVAALEAGAAVEIAAIPGGIRVKGASRVAVCNLQGIIVYRGAESEIATGAGIFMVVADGLSRKVIVKE